MAFRPRNGYQSRSRLRACQIVIHTSKNPSGSFRAVAGPHLYTAPALSGMLQLNRRAEFHSLQTLNIDMDCMTSKSSKWLFWCASSRKHQFPEDGLSDRSVPEGSVDCGAAYVSCGVSRCLVSILSATEVSLQHKPSNNYLLRY